MYEPNATGCLPDIVDWAFEGRLCNRASLKLAAAIASLEDRLKLKNIFKENVISGGPPDFSPQSLVARPTCLKPSIEKGGAEIRYYST